MFGIGSKVSNMSSQSQARDIAEAKEARAATEHGLKMQETTMKAPEGVAGTELTLTTPEGEKERQLRIPLPPQAKKEDPLLAGKLKLQTIETGIKQAQLDSVGKPKKMQSLKPTDIKSFGEGTSASMQLGMLRGTMDKYKHKFGPIEGVAGGFNKYDTEAQTVQASVDIAKQTIGKFLEGGVMRKEDEAKYAKILPKLGDTYEVAMAKIDMIEDMLNKKISHNISVLESHGYDITGLAPPGLNQWQMAQGQQQPQQYQPQGQPPAAGGFGTAQAAPAPAQPFNPSEYLSKRGQPSR
jgi:hypothetical protein